MNKILSSLYLTLLTIIYSFELSQVGLPPREDYHLNPFSFRQESLLLVL